MRALLNWALVAVHITHRSSACEPEQVGEIIDQPKGRSASLEPDHELPYVWLQEHDLLQWNTRDICAAMRSKRDFERACGHRWGEHDGNGEAKQSSRSIAYRVRFPVH